MAFSLLAGAVRAGLAAQRPAVPDAPVDMFQLFYATDSGVLSLGVGGADEWLDLAAIAGAGILSELPTSDPAAAGELWNDGGVLKVSEGE